MLIEDQRISNFFKYYNELKNTDLHMYSEDDYPTKRIKDMDFGKVVACERIIDILNLVKD